MNLPSTADIAGDRWPIKFKAEDLFNRHIGKNEASFSEFNSGYCNFIEYILCAMQYAQSWEIKEG